ncbi:MAG: hypothetical protein IKJ98_10390 [Bacteroidales bacterium]|nr:hypothetical protein [Bacteroidales bacterium]MBR4116113.1 hypothetical protein [Bacteroidales bacterium]MBR6265304.1 hypothetical protein [Bacteroidales bacterium]
MNSVDDQWADVNSTGIHVDIGYKPLKLTISCLETLSDSIPNVKNGIGNMHIYNILKTRPSLSVLNIAKKINPIR